MVSPSLFTRFLTALGVPHTVDYSDQRFRSMPFNSLFGLSHLLGEYGVENEAVRVADKSELTKIQPPFLAQMTNGVFVIVEKFDTANSAITYDSTGVIESAPLGEFESAWNGVALMAFPSSTSAEPQYGSHHLTQITKWLSTKLLVVGALFIFVYFFFSRGMYHNLSTTLIALLDLAGLYLSYLLMQKTLGFHSAAGDRVCSVIEEGGCDTIVKLKVSKLFGVFSWSEVGFGYFGVSLATLLMFPHMWPALALCNILCLPYSFWSVWYQKFRAKNWCTLCLSVQTTLWLLFFCFLGGGWLGKAFPLHFDVLVLIAVYASAVVAINLVIRTLKNIPQNDDENNKA